MNEEEIWRDVEGYEGLYQVSNMGRVKSLDRYGPHNKGGRRLIKGRVLKPKKNKEGYEHLTLCRDGCLRYFRVNRLVAQAFVENPNPEHFDQVNHKNEQKDDNRADNLEWCDSKYNVNYGTARERQGETLSKPVCGYTNQCEVVIRIKSAAQKTFLVFCRRRR